VTEIVGLLAAGDLAIIQAVGYDAIAGGLLGL
jgi:hypothetical protein